MRLPPLGAEQEAVWFVDWADALCLLSMECVRDLQPYLGIGIADREKVRLFFVDVVRRNADNFASYEYRDEDLISEVLDGFGTVFGAGHGSSLLEWFTTIYQWDKRWVRYTGATRRWLASLKGRGAAGDPHTAGILGAYQKLERLENAAETMMKSEMSKPLSDWDQLVIGTRRFSLAPEDENGTDSDDEVFPVRFVFASVDSAIRDNLFQLFWEELMRSCTPRCLEELVVYAMKERPTVGIESLRRTCAWHVPWISG